MSKDSQTQRPPPRPKPLPLSVSQTQTETSPSREIDVHLAEYQALCASPNSQLELSHQVFSLTITAVGILLAASPFIVGSETFLIFAVSSFVFYALALTQLRHALAVSAIGAYVSSGIAPRLRVLLSLLPYADESHPSNVLLWSQSWAEAAYGSKWWQLPLEAARYLVPIVAGVCSLFAYLYLDSDRTSPIALMVAALNLVAIVYLAVVARSLRRDLLDRLRTGKPADSEPD